MKLIVALIASLLVSFAFANQEALMCDTCLTLMDNGMSRFSHFVLLTVSLERFDPNH